jgi:hypothetical protein
MPFMDTKNRVRGSARDWAKVLLVALLSGCGSESKAPPLASSSVPPADSAALTSTSLQAWSTCPWGSTDCNPCVPNVVSAFNALSHHGDILGFHMGAGTADVTATSHWQGVQRLMAGDGRYLAVSRSGAGQMFVVVRMASRNTSGVRMRSNRKNASWFVERTAPPSTDIIVKVQGQDVGYDHAGGMQALGNYLSVPLETSGQSKVVFYDMSNPELPVRLHELNHSSVNGVSGIGEAGTASLTKLSDGRFLHVIGRKDTNALDFYLSSTTSLASPDFAYFGTWTRGQGVGSTIGDFTWGKYQSVNLVNQCDGNLFLVGTHNNGDIAWQDWADLFRLDIDGTSKAISLTKVAKKHMYCGFNGTNHCNLDAAAGVSVAPDQSLLLYATEHDNDGPIYTGGSMGGASGSIKLEEFRPNPHRSTCTSIDDAWVELFDDSGLQDRSLMVDYVDRILENESNYDSFEGFEDKTSSVRWCIPVGWRYRLYADKNPCGGSYKDLVGNGAVQTLSNLGDIGFNDKVSCSKWLQQ